ncbi:universal stress protein [Vreelandella boliviensis]|uniref:Universal stress protein n=1 Tax=Vreelandella boliviensis LC1 TaxID=1072583 RepID=A0A265DZ60_9GAMM|nr:universal stress protein [Halomonas boliviensis]EHJ93971.1 Universal stress protein F [Halomonas boliviensis LC1]OZT74609.1 universal stress protein [Halomonas boliviensis LC1]
MYKNILITTAADNNSNVLQKIEVARKLSGEDSTIQIISVMERIPPYIAPSLPSDYRETTTQRIKDDIRKRIGDEHYAIHVVEGHAAHQVVKFARRNGVDCIIVSSNRPGFPDHFMGSTALSIVRQAECTVTVVR